jgi:hypothetical protein
MLKEIGIIVLRYAIKIVHYYYFTQPLLFSTKVKIANSEELLVNVSDIIIRRNSPSWAM